MSSSSYSLIELTYAIINRRFSLHHHYHHHHHHHHHVFTPIPILLAISGSDSCGGAGQQADIKTATVLNVFTASCITAITVQNTQGVQHVEISSPRLVESQIRAVCDDMQVDAVKIGLTGSKEIIEVIARMIREYNLRNVVLDPVMAASRYGLVRNDSCYVYILYYHTVIYV